MDKLEIAKLVQLNNREEAEAILDYTDLLNNIQSSTLTEEEKTEITAQINEIIGDELNHQQRLQEIYTYLTQIQISAD